MSGTARTLLGAQGETDAERDVREEIREARRTLSGILLSADPAAELRAARDSGDLVRLMPPFARSVGYDQRSRFHALPLDEHVFSVVEGVADDAPSLQLRLAAFMHDIGKPAAAFRGDDGRIHYGGWPGAGVPSHEEISAAIAAEALGRLGYGQHLTMRVVELVRWHMPRERQPEHADRLARHLGPLAGDLCVLRRNDAMSKSIGRDGTSPALGAGGRSRLALFERTVARLGL